MKKMLAVLLTLTLMLTNLGAVLAETISAPPASQISANPNYASVEKTFSAAGNMRNFAIDFIRESISKKSSTSISISAVTETNTTAVRLGGAIYVQQWKNNAWSNYGSTSFWNYDTTRASTLKTLSVESGYYYRLKVYHRATDNTGTVQVVSTTSSILVD
nr:hypothetical protein [Clostridia bacterium]